RAYALRAKRLYEWFGRRRCQRPFYTNCRVVLRRAVLDDNPIKQRQVPEDRLQISQLPPRDHEQAPTRSTTALQRGHDIVCDNSVVRQRSVIIASQRAISHV